MMEIVERVAEQSQRNNTGAGGTPLWRIPDTYLGAYPEGQKP